MNLVQNFYEGDGSFIQSQRCLTPELSLVPLALPVAVELKSKLKPAAAWETILSESET